MEKYIIAMIILTGILNMHADRLLLAGKIREGKGLKGADYYLAIGKTNTVENLFKSAKLGGCMIACWMAVLLYVMRLPGKEGQLAALFYALFVGFNMLGHVMTAHCFIMMKDRVLRPRDIKKQFVFFMVMTLIFATAYSGVLAYMGVKNLIVMKWYHYLTLPVLMIIGSQIVVGTLIKSRRIKEMAGTFGQMIAMLMTVHLVMMNSTR